MKFLIVMCVAVTLLPWQCYSLSVSLEEDPILKSPAPETPKAKPSRSLVAVNEQSQERSSSRFFGPPISGYPGAYQGVPVPYQNPVPFQGGFGFSGYPQPHPQPGGYSGYPGGFIGGYPGAFPAYPYGAFAGHNGFGYGVQQQQQQQQQLQGGGYSSGAYAG